MTACNDGCFHTVQAPSFTKIGAKWSQLLKPIQRTLSCINMHLKFHEEIKYLGCRRAELSSDSRQSIVKRPLKMLELAGRNITTKSSVVCSE
jgi:hypothetical protein